MLTEGPRLDFGREVWDKEWEQEMNENHLTHNELIKWAEFYLKGFRGKQTLEVGSGSGADSAEIAKRGATAWTVDFSGNATKLTRLTASKDNVNVQTVLAHASNLPFPDSTFDLVFSEGLLEHVSAENREQVLGEQLRVVKPRGIVIVDVPYAYEIRKGCDEALRKLEEAGRVKPLRQYNWQITTHTVEAGVRFEAGRGYVYRDTRSQYFPSSSA